MTNLKEMLYRSAVILLLGITSYFLKDTLDQISKVKSLVETLVIATGHNNKDIQMHKELLAEDKTSIREIKEEVTKIRYFLYYRLKSPAMKPKDIEPVIDEN